MPPARQLEFKNQIVARLPEKDFTALRPLLERMPLKAGDVLESAGEHARSVYFLDTGIISLLAPLEQGARLEVGHVGREGATGVHAALGAETSTSEMLVQGDGIAFRADVTAVRQLLDRNRGLQRGLVRFANALHVQVAQTAACNGSHEVVQRLARWLLMVHDRTDGDMLILTHEVISLVLGVTRPGVTIAAGTLQKAGLIQYSRGRLTIVDRDGLEQAACECYRIVATYYRAELA
jgi:CRP-like cAMP-binding protein